MMKNLILYIFLFLCIGACKTTNAKKENAFVSVWLPFSPERVKQVYNHSLVKSYRQSSDCGYHCPDVDIWEYKYKDPKTGKIITSKKPIASQKRFWKSPHEARIIAISLYGKAFYFDALLMYLESIKNINEINKIHDKIWGFETFTVRVYIAKRNPRDEARLGKISNETPDYMIQKLLDLGCEIAFVDNKLSEAKKDGSFWRFAVTSEKMPPGQRIRYLLRDADSLLTAAEVFTVADWISSGKQFHRMHVIPICMGPLTASWWGGTHVGEGHFKDFHDLVKNYPYRFDYGDDELFSRDLLWPRIKAIGSVLTHHFPRGGFVNTLGNPYKNSCEEPTDDFCSKLNPKSECEDRILPQTRNFGGVIQALGLRTKLDELKQKHPEYFDLELYKPENQFIYKNLKSK
jgi:hypothetical protein